MRSGVSTLHARTTVCTLPRQVLRRALMHGVAAASKHHGSVLGSAHKSRSLSLPATGAISTEESGHPQYRPRTCARNPRSCRWSDSYRTPPGGRDRCPNPRWQRATRRRLKLGVRYRHSVVSALSQHGPGELRYLRHVVIARKHEDAFSLIVAGAPATRVYQKYPVHCHPSIC